MSENPGDPGFLKNGSNPIDRWVVFIKGVLGPIPFVGPLLSEIVGSFIPNQRLDKLEQFLSYMNERVEELEKIFERIKGDRPKEELIDRILSIVTKPGSEQKFHALGKVLMEGAFANSKEELDELVLMLRVIEDLEEPHIKVLDTLYKADRKKGVPDYELAKLFSNGFRLMYSILKTLERHGLAGPIDEPSTVPSVDRVYHWVIWDFGELLIERLSDTKN